VPQAVSWLFALYAAVLTALGRLVRAKLPPHSSAGPARHTVFVMEAAENRASHDFAVLGQGMSVVTLQR